MLNPGAAPAAPLILLEMQNAIKTADLSRSQFVRIRFPASRSKPETDFYFGSLSAAFDVFSEEDLGVSLRVLYSAGLVGDGPPFVTSLGVEIKKLTMLRKKQKKS